MNEDQSLKSQLLMLAVSITGTAILVWMELPPDQRVMLALEAKTRLYQGGCTAPQSGQAAPGWAVSCQDGASPQRQGTAWRSAWRGRGTGST